MDGHAAVLGFVRGLDLAAHELDDELHAVADAENRDGVCLAVIEEVVWDGGCALDVDGVGAAGEDDHGRVVRRDASLCTDAAREGERSDGQRRVGGSAGARAAVPIFFEYRRER